MTHHVSNQPDLCSAGKCPDIFLKSSVLSPNVCVMVRKDDGRLQGSEPRGSDTWLGFHLSTRSLPRPGPNPPGGRPHVDVDLLDPALKG